MGQIRIRKKFGKALRKLREAKKFSLDQVIAKVALLGIECSKSNLSRIEMDQTSCRTDIFAALCYLYGAKPEELMYEKRNFN